MRHARLTNMPFVYILKCSDNSYYVGSAIDLELRLQQHQTGFFKGYTETRRPVELLWWTELPTDDEAFICERQLKGWTRAKKEALICGDWDGIHLIVKQERKSRERSRRKANAVR